MIWILHYNTQKNIETVSIEQIYDVYSEEKQTSFLLLMFFCTYTLKITPQHILYFLKEDTLFLYSEEKPCSVQRF